MKDDEMYMRQALAEARKAEYEGEIPIGAVIVCKGRIIARAHNLTERLHDVTAHAEMQAITAAAEYLGGKYLTDCTLYVTYQYLWITLWKTRQVIVELSTLSTSEKEPI